MTDLPADFAGNSDIRAMAKDAGILPAVDGKKPAEVVKEFAQWVLEDPEYRLAAKARIAAGLASHLETLLFHYAYGKPTERIELEAGSTLSDLVEASRKRDRKELDVVEEVV